MKAALIPPKGFEHTILSSDIHLVLPLRVCRNNKDYVSAYKEARRRGHYIILDNGCAEGQLVDGKTLLDFAVEIGAHEIVAPDIMGDAAGTLETTLDFLKRYRRACDYNIMGVLQGETLEEALSLADKYSDIPYITAIGIPKYLIKKPYSTIRREVADYILSRYPNRFDVHLLGLSNNYPAELLSVKFPKKVRSVDSAHPYKCAELGKALTPFVGWTKRRLDYFETVKPMSISLLSFNIDQFIDWARMNES